MGARNKLVIYHQTIERGFIWYNNPLLFKSCFEHLKATGDNTGRIDFGNRSDQVTCVTGEKLLYDDQLFNECNDPYMIKCHQTKCAQGMILLLATHNAVFSLKFASYSGTVSAM